MDEWIPTDHGIENEPQLQQPGSFRADPTEQDAAETLHAERTADDPTGRAASQSVHEEVHTLYSAGAPKGTSWGAWYTAMCAGVSFEKSIVAIALVALLGGPFAIVGAFLANVEGILSTVVFGPTIEEVLKIGLLAILVETRPYLLLSSIQIRVAAVLSAFTFAAVENLLYINIYIDDPPDSLVLWRWTVCIALHVAATSIAAEGLVRAWNRSRETLKRPTLDHSYAWLFYAIVLHGAYNFAATAWELGS